MIEPHSIEYHYVKLTYNNNNIWYGFRFNGIYIDYQMYAALITSTGSRSY